MSDFIFANKAAINLDKVTHFYMDEEKDCIMVVLENGTSICLQSLEDACLEEFFEEFCAMVENKELLEEWQPTNTSIC